MIVYRLCSKEEVDLILERRELTEIGKTFSNNKELNNHNYDSNRKYLHFFASKSSLFYLCVTTGTYICTYDIPTDILNKYIGEGYYLDRLYLKNLNKVIEYAVPSDEILFEYLQKIERIKSYVDYEDYLYDWDIRETEIIYNNKDKEKVLEKTI